MACIRTRLEKRSPLGRIRTSDLRFRKPVLYPLSYEGYINIPAGRDEESIFFIACEIDL